MNKTAQNLYDDRFFPITRELSFVAAAPSTVSSFFVEWQVSIHPTWGTKYSQAGSICVGLEQFAPLSSWPTRWLFGRTDSPWTLVLKNANSFPDVSSFLWVIRKDHHVPTIQISDTTYPDGSLRSLLFIHEDGDERRHIGVVANDSGRLEFWDTSNPFPGEDTSTYTKRRIKDRFGYEQLAQVCGLFGLRPFDDSFYPEGAGASMVEVFPPEEEYEAVATEVSYEQAKRHWYGDA